MYAGAEAFVTYGASKDRYVELLDGGLDPSQATGLYALREVLADHSSTTESFATLVAALQRIGVDPTEVHTDVEAALIGLYDSGMINPANERGGPLARSYISLGSSAINPVGMYEVDPRVAMTAELVENIHSLGLLPSEEVDGDFITPEDRYYL